MNCKPGDLAVYVGRQSACLGQMVTVVSSVTPDGWWVEPGLIGAEKHPNMVYDRALRPIRDPGPEAVDEMVQKLGSPNKQGEMA